MTQANENAKGEMEEAYGERRTGAIHNYRAKDKVRGKYIALTLEEIPEEQLVKLLADDIHLTIPLEEFLDNLTLEKRNPFDPNAVALKDGDALALDEESDEDEDRFILKDDKDC